LFLKPGEREAKGRGGEGKKKKRWWFWRKERAVMPRKKGKGGFCRRKGRFQ